MALDDYKTSIMNDSQPNFFLPKVGHSTCFYCLKVFIIVTPVDVYKPRKTL